MDRGRSEHSTDAPLYFPITKYGANRPAGQQEVRAAEAYFVKFPVELFDVIPGIGSARIDTPLDPLDTDLPEDFQPPGKKAPAGAPHVLRTPSCEVRLSAGRSMSPRPTTWASSSGTDYEEVGKPYDIEVTVQGSPAMRSQRQLDGDRHSRAHCQRGRARHAFTPIDLIVVDNIVPTRDPDTGEVTGATGGRRRIWVDWTPLQSDLKATSTPTRFPRCLRET